MKKLVIGMFAFCLSMGMISCGNKTAGGDGKDSTATEAKAEVKKVDINDVIAKAKAEGANWDEAQWKQAYRDVMTAATPLFDWARGMSEKMKELDNGGDDAAKLAEAAKFMEEAEAKQKEFEPLTKAMEEFMEIAENNPTAKKVMDDKAFQEEMKKEFNLPEEMF